MWFLIIRPQRRRQQEAQRLLTQIAVGKEIVTAGGLYGGLEVVLQAVRPKNHKLTADDISRSIDVLREQIEKLGVSQPEIRKQGTDQIVIQLAGVHDPAAAAKLIGKTGVLEFYDF